MILGHGTGECLSGWFLSLVSGFNMRGGQPRRVSDDGECFMEEGGTGAQTLAWLGRACQLSSMMRCKDDAMMMGVVVRWMKFSAYAVIIISIIMMLTPISPLY